MHLGEDTKNETACWGQCRTPKVSHRGCQLPTAQRHQNSGSRADGGERRRGGRSASPSDGSLILGKTKWKKQASRSSGRVCHMYTTVTCHSLIVVKLGRASSALLTWFGPVYESEESLARLFLSLFPGRELFCQTPRALYPSHSKTHLNASRSRRGSLFTTGLLEMVKGPPARRSQGMSLSGHC